MTTESILGHTYITILGSLLGMLLGIGVGLIAVKISQRITQDGKKFYPVGLFIPWRTILVGLLLLNYFPVWMVTQFGLGNDMGILSVAYVVFIATVVVFSQFLQDKPSPLIMQLLPWFRTLIVFAVILTTHYGAWGGGGLGDYAYMRIAMMEFDAAWSVLWVLCGIAFLIDEFAALLQWLINARMNRVKLQSETVD